MTAVAPVGCKETTVLMPFCWPCDTQILCYMHIWYHEWGFTRSSSHIPIIALWTQEQTAENRGSSAPKQNCDVNIDGLSLSSNMLDVKNEHSGLQTWKGRLPNAYGSLSQTTCRISTGDHYCGSTKISHIWLTNWHVPVTQCEWCILE